MLSDLRTAHPDRYNIIGYVANPSKTERGQLVTGYACDPETAEGEFLLMKREYLERTGRVRGKDDVIAYHLRQSFVPGEITPEEANRIGRELAERFTHRQRRAKNRERDARRRAKKAAEQQQKEKQA